MTLGVTCHLSLGQHSRWDDFGVVWYYRTWTAYTVGECQVRHSIMAIGQNTRSNDVGRGMAAWPLGTTHGWMTSGVGCDHPLLTAYMVDDILRAIPSSPLEAQAVG